MTPPPHYHTTADFPTPCKPPSAPATMQLATTANHKIRVPVSVSVSLFTSMLSIQLLHPYKSRVRVRHKHRNPCPASRHDPNSEQKIQKSNPNLNPGVARESSTRPAPDLVSTQSQPTVISANPSFPSACGRAPSESPNRRTRPGVSPTTAVLLPAPKPRSSLHAGMRRPLRRIDASSTPMVALRRRPQRDLARADFVGPAQCRRCAPPALCSSGATFSRRRWELERRRLLERGAKHPQIRPTPATDRPPELATGLSWKQWYYRFHQLRTSGSQKKNTRGKTRGKAVEKMVQKTGKLQVPIPTTERAPVGENATALANQIGIEIRAAAPLQDVMYWDDVDDSLKKSIILRVRDKFEIKNYDDDEVVRRAITKICQLRYKDWRSRMHAHYKNLLKNGVNPRSKPYKGVSQEDWEYMIDRVWTTDEKFKKRSEQNVVARSSLPWNHSCGSKSFAATMSTKAEMPHFVDFFKESHWSKKKDDWLDPKCMEKHGELENLRTMCSQPNAIPMSEEEMSVAVLGKKSSYLRGYGVGRKPSNTKTTFRENGEEAIILREELTSLKELNETQQQQL